MCDFPEVNYKRTLRQLYLSRLSEPSLRPCANREQSRALGCSHREQSRAARNWATAAVDSNNSLAMDVNNLELAVFLLLDDEPATERNRRVPGHNNTYGQNAHWTNGPEMKRALTRQSPTRNYELARRRVYRFNPFRSPHSLASLKMR
jgi:hypothetical protein